MWKKATCYKSATLAALVVASSLALLTGAQAEELSLTPTTASVTFLPNPSFLGQPGLTMIPNLGSIAAPGGIASFAGLSDGTFNCTCIAQGVGGFDGTNFNTTAGQGSSIFRATFADGNTLSAFLRLSTILNANTNDPTIIGTYQRSTSTGVFADPSIFPLTGTIDLPLMINGPLTLAELLGMSSGSVSSTVTTPAGLNLPEAPPPEIPLPPAIYLFGSVLGGAFWLGRRKRSAVSSL